MGVTDCVTAALGTHDALDAQPDLRSRLHKRATHGACRTAATPYLQRMLSSLLKRLAGAATSQPLDADDARTAVAALLVMAAHADHDYADSERTQIEQVLALRYGLNHAEAAALRAEGEAAEAAAVDLFRFTTLIKEAVPHDERTGVLEALWQVALADGARERHEDALIRRLTDLLGLTDRDSALARQRVLQS